MDQGHDRGAVAARRAGVVVRCALDGRLSDVFLDVHGREGAEPLLSELVAMAPDVVRAARKAMNGPAGSVFRITGIAYEAADDLGPVPFRVSYHDGGGFPFTSDVAASTTRGAFLGCFWAHASARARPEDDEEAFAGELAGLTPILAVEVPAGADVGGGL